MTHVVPETVVVALPEPTAVGLGDELVILNPLTGHYYGLEGVGVFIWQRLQTPVTAGKLHEALQAHYQVGAEQSWADLAQLLAALEAAQLIAVDAPPA